MTRTLTGHLFAPDDRGLCTVTVADGVVASIEPAAEAASAARDAGAIGGPGSRILPGLLDVQINGAFGDDFADAATDMGAICRGLPRFGVTGFAPTIVTSAREAYAPALANLRRSAAPGEARVLGVHVEGPFLSPKHPGSHSPEHLRLPDVPEAAAWLEAGDVRWLTLAPELPGALELIRFLVERGVRVSVGHTDATWAEAAEAVDAGASLATHLFNAMRPLRHRDPGVAGYVLASHVPAGFIGDGNHLSFDMLRLLVRIKGPDELFVVSDALAGLGMPPGRYRLAERYYISDGTCGRLPDGTLSGSLLPLNLALRNLVEVVGVEPAVAVRFATLNPARALDLERFYGRVEVGRAADLVVVDEHWNVEATLVGGEIAYLAEPADDAGRVGRAPATAGARGADDAGAPAAIAR